MPREQLQMQNALDGRLVILALFDLIAWRSLGKSCSSLNQHETKKGVLGRDLIPLRVSFGFRRLQRMNQNPTNYWAALR